MRSKSLTVEEECIPPNVDTIVAQCLPLRPCLDPCTLHGVIWMWFVLSDHDELGVNQHSVPPQLSPTKVNLLCVREAAHVPSSPR